MDVPNFSAELSSGIFGILLLLIILWIYTQPRKKSSPIRNDIQFHRDFKRYLENLEDTNIENSEIEDDQIEGVKEKLRQIKNKLRKVLSVISSGLLDFIIIPSDTTTYVVNKREIHLVIMNMETGQFYDDNTLLHAAIHELAHILCPDDSLEGHSPLFDKIEDHLLEIAWKMGFYDPDIDLDEDYPCQS